MSKGWCDANRAGQHKWYDARGGHQICRLCGERRLVQSRAKMPTEGTQAWHVLKLLQSRDYLCSYEFYNMPGDRITHRLAARIGDLKKLGWSLDRRSCQTHQHKTAAVEYYLKDRVNG